MMDIFEEKRKSWMDFDQPYFYTATVLAWKKLFVPDKYKQLLINSLSYLVSKGTILIYGFVIMPNHIHLIWEMKAKNSKEKPAASFLKFTAHGIEQDLRLHHPLVLPHFEVEQTDRKYQFWQRDSLAVLLADRKICEQKLDYIHNNPLAERWQLAKCPEEYHWSSASFYETGKDDFGFLTHYLDRF